MQPSAPVGQGNLSEEKDVLTCSVVGAAGQLAAWQLAQISSEATSRVFNRASAARRRVSLPGSPQLPTTAIAEAALHVRSGLGGGAGRGIGR
jgi:hypothetical protein